MWLCLFMTPSEIGDNGAMRSKWKGKCDPFIPFGTRFKGESKEQLSAIYREIPDGIMHDWYEKRSEFQSWWIKHHQHKTSAHNKLFDKINTAFISYPYWCKFVELALFEPTATAIQFYDKHREYIDINQRKMRWDGKTLLHLSLEDEIWNSRYGKMKETTMRWIVSLEDMNDQIRDIEGETAMDIAKRKGLWNRLNIMLFAKMSGKMRQKADEQVTDLNGNKAIVKQWFRFNELDINKQQMVKMVESIITLIEDRLPLSDDMLMIALQFEMRQNGGNPLQTSLWRCLYATLEKILRIPLNRRNWLWFKQYIFNSCIWFEKDPNDKLLYDLLIAMVSKQLIAQRDYLQPYIDNFEEKKDDDSWEKLKHFAEFMITDHSEGLRQDICIDKTTQKEALSHPIKPLFGNDELHELNGKVKNFNCHNHYDVNGYLSQLILTAHSLDPTFHKAMRFIMDINEENDKNEADGVKYLQGPVKKLQRAQAKAESDYSHCSYPTTAKVVDFIRCCLIYKNPSDLLKGIEKFMSGIDEKVKASENLPFCPICNKGPMKQRTIAQSGSDRIVCAQCMQWHKKTHYHCRDDTNCDMDLCIECVVAQQQLYGIKKILRIKNMFLDNKRENEGNWDLYKYADIKMGVLVEHGGQSMIAEVQFLLNFMLEAKSLGHGLYEIERNKDFITDIDKILTLRAGDDGIWDENDVMEALRKAVTDGNENEAATLILNEAPVDFMKIDENGKGLAHYAVEHDHKKILKLLLDTVKIDRTKDEFERFINMKSKKGQTPLTSVLYGNMTSKKEAKLSIFRLLLSYEELDVNLKARDDEVPVLWIAVHERGEHHEFMDLLLKDGRCDLSLVKDKKNYLAASLHTDRCDNIQARLCMFDQLWKSGQFAVDDVNVLLHYVVKYVHTSYSLMKLMEHLLKIDGVDINNTLDGNTSTVLHDVVKQDWVNMNMIQYLLGLPSLDTNALDDEGRTAAHILFKKKDDFLKDKAMNGADCANALEFCPKTESEFFPWIKLNQVCYYDSDSYYSDSSSV